MLAYRKIIILINSESHQHLTHVEWPNANDNVTANQLQGHTGTITGCDTCHLPSAFEDSGELQLTINDPHGMHPVGSRHWNTHHEEARQGG